MYIEAFLELEFYLIFNKFFFVVEEGEIHETNSHVYVSMDDLIGKD